MARVDIRRRRIFRIYAVILLLLLSCFVLSACNADSGTFDVSGDAVSEPSHFIAKLMYGLDDDIAVFGWSVVAFTVILKLVLSPLDIWQRVISRRNAKAMERMRPQLEALQEKFGDDKQRYQQEQMALYKKEKYSMFGACLPSLVTLVVFFVVFAGFREMVGYQFAQDYHSSYIVFEQVMEDELGEGYETIEKTEENAALYDAAVDKAQQAVYDAYFSDARTEKREFLWIHNIFVSDSWQDGVPDYLTATGQEGFAMSKITGVTKDEYNLVMGKVIGADEAGWGKGGASWNGWLLLPALSIALSFVSEAAHQVAGCSSSLRKREKGHRQYAVQHEDDAVLHAAHDRRVRAVLFGGVRALHLHELARVGRVPACVRAGGENPRQARGE